MVVCVRGGGISSGRVYAHVVKLMGGLCPRIKIRAGGGLFGGYCPTLSHCALKHFNAPHREGMRYLNVFTTHRCVVNSDAI